MRAEMFVDFHFFRYDATPGDFPRHTLIDHVTCREVGIFQKQARCDCVSFARLLFLELWQVFAIIIVQRCVTFYQFNFSLHILVPVLLNMMLIHRHSREHRQKD